ncbi:Nucleoside-diphosphate-sugar epimerase [Cohaesibacter sp. ES.047]|uniref:NAD(P)H-binding protein n=1 Tax=Cohaesibacter sp. ES.047 TaxID=1798205 RepID=UPI000BB6FEB9|nr:NAD(P)H-binding protein [Cohaesibacter sp. ES.047]SNY93349.1 Nucleoside-diphosphate-sugar epimerase [Cohaesibacter sp. ES.047]
MTTTVTVAGASGLVGSNIIREALERGYKVNGTMRDAQDTEKTKWLMALPGAAERLKLFSADARDSNSFGPALEGADAIFIACFPPIYFASDGTPARELDRERGYQEIVAPVRDGCLNVLEATKRAGVKHVMLCSSTSSTNPPEGVAVKTETNAISDAEFQMAEKKFTSAEKIVMETAARDFCVRHNMRLAIFLPTMMLGQVILPQHIREHQGFLARPILEGKANHERVPKGSMSLAHVGDVAKLFLNAYETGAAGRFFAVYDSLPWRELYSELAKHIPASVLPAPFEGDPEEPTRFDFTRRDSLGVEMRDSETTIAEVSEWLKSRPFG